jgi:multiple sugar transport system substrate-binding protein
LGVGCFDSQQPAERSDARPFEGQTVTVRVPRGLGLPQRLELVAEEWSNRTGAAAEIQEYAPDDASAAKSKGAQVVLFPITQLAERAAAESLTEIPADLRAESGFDWLDVFQGLREKVCSLERQPYVVPLSCPVLVCYYRRDLLEKAGLRPPETWKDYDELVRGLDRWAPGLTTVEPWGEDFRATMFLSRAAGYVKSPAQFSVFFDIDSGEPLIATPGFVRALEEIQSLLASLPDAVTNYAPQDCRREVLEGRAAIGLAYEAEAGSAPTQRPDGVSIAVSRLPGADQVYSLATASWGSPSGERANHATLTAFDGYCAGVSGGGAAETADAAWDLLQAITVEQRETALPPQILSPCRQSQLADGGRWTGPGLLPSESEEYLRTVAASLQDTNLVAELPVTGRERFRAALNEGLSRVLGGEESPQAALENVAAAWKQIAAELGPERVRDSYRRSLGLRALSATAR